MLKDTASPRGRDIRDDCMAAVDAEGLGGWDVIVIHRNHDRDQTDARIKHAVELMLSGYSDVLIMVNEDNTSYEADRIHGIVWDCGWNSVTIVTHRYHHYRAYLTFLRDAV